MNTVESKLDRGASPFFIREARCKFFVMYPDLSWNEVPDAMSNFQAPFIEWKGESGAVAECRNIAIEFCELNDLNSPTLHIVWGAEHNSDKFGAYIRSDL